MAGRSSEIVDLRGFLAPGIHDVMIEILGPKGQSRRIASAMILRISEACLPVYPLSTTDYLVSQNIHIQSQSHSGKAVLVPVKIRIKKEKSPRLFALHGSIAYGAKNQAILNLMCRHLALNDHDPDLVHQLINNDTPTGAPPAAVAVTEPTSVTSGTGSPALATVAPEPVQLVSFPGVGEMVISEVLELQSIAPPPSSLFDEHDELFGADFGSMFATPSTQDQSGT